LEGEESESESEAGSLVDNVNDAEDAEDDEGDEVPDEVEASDEDEPVLEKPVRVTRVRQKAIVQAEVPEIEEDTSADSSPYRLKVIEVLHTLFAEKLDADTQASIEKTIFKKAIETAKGEEIRKTWSSQAFRDVYSAVSRRMIGNLNPDSYIQNKNLWIRFTTNELTLDEIAKQNYYELCPENWQQMVDRQAKRETIQLEGDFSRATDKWMCHGCKKRKCTYYELQTRSSDEPMTIFIHCLNCGKRWTQ
jgi:transcription elongation factor S-II